MGRTQNNALRYRAIGAGWFALAALLVAGSLYLVPALESGRLSALVLFVLLPGLAAAPVGAWFAPAVLAPRRSGPVKAAGLGVLTALLAHLLYSLFFGIAWWMLHPEPTNPPGMTLATLILGFTMVSPVSLPAGAFGGWLLYWCGQQWRKRHPDDDGVEAGHSDNPEA